MAQKPKKRRRSRNDPHRKKVQQQREEARRRLAEQRRIEAEAEARKKERLALVRRFGLPTLAGLAVITIALVLFRPARELPAVQQPVLIEATELAVDATFDYGTPTPSSGPFLPGLPTCGAFTEAVAPEAAVTAMYHGGVVLWHSPEMSDADVASLKNIVDEFPADVVVSPNADITDPVVAASWGRLRAYDGPGADVREFVMVYRDRAIETGECPL